MSEQFGEYGTTRGVEDAVRSFARSEVQSERPKSRYALVKSVDVNARKAQVQYNGDSSLVWVPYGSERPAYLDQPVLIEGADNDRHIAQVIGNTQADVDLAALTATTTGTIAWVAPTLATGVTTHSTDPVKYRKYTDHGSVKIELRGRVNISGTRTLLWTMPSDYRPLLNMGHILVARDVAGGAIAAQIEVLSSGAVNLVGHTTGAVSGATDTVDPNDNTTGVTNSYDGGFATNPTRARTSGPTIIVNNGDTTHQHLFSHDHGVTGGHSHTVAAPAAPTFISFNGVHYYIS